MDRALYLGLWSSVWGVVSVLSASTVGKPVQPNSHGIPTGKETDIVSQDVLEISSCVS